MNEQKNCPRVRVPGFQATTLTQRTALRDVLFYFVLFYFISSNRFVLNLKFGKFSQNYFRNADTG